MTLNEIEQDIYRRLGKDTTPVTATQTRIRAFVNQRHRELLAMPDCQQLRDATLTFATVANQYFYALPQAIARIHRIVDTANERVLSEVDLSWYRDMAPDPTVRTGYPECFASLGQTRVAKQPTAATALSVKSDNAGDTMVLRIEGIVTGGYAQIVYGFARDWTAGVRFDRVNGRDSETFGMDDRDRWSLALTYFTSEFAKVRLQLNRDRAQSLMKDVTSVWLQIEINLGQHGAHKF